MRFKPKSIGALHLALGGLPDKMRVEADPDIGVSAKTVRELRKLAAWPENLAVTTPQDRNPENASGKAASAMVGTSGRSVERTALVTASMRSLPLWAFSCVAGTGAKAIGMWPPSRSTIAGPVPL